MNLRTAPGLIAAKRPSLALATAAEREPVFEAYIGAKARAADACIDQQVALDQTLAVIRQFAPGGGIFQLRSDQVQSCTAALNALFPSETTA